MFHHFFRTLKKHLGFMLFVGFAAAIIAALVTLALPREYRADAQILIISQTRFGVDPYTVVKSAERIGENLVQIIRSNDFYEKVMALEGYSVDTSRFDDVSERKKRKRWVKAVEPSVVYGTGVLNLSAYHTDPSEARELASAASDALVSHGWEYVGGDVSMKIVNSPVVTNWPVRPNIIFTTIAGFILGIFFSGLLLVRS